MLTENSTLRHVTFSHLIEFSRRLHNHVCLPSLKYKALNADLVPNRDDNVCKSYVRDFDFSQRSIDSQMNRPDYFSRWITLSRVHASNFSNFPEISMNDLRRMLPEIEREPKLRVVPSASQLMTRTKSLTKREIHPAVWTFQREMMGPSCCSFRSNF